MVKKLSEDKKLSGASELPNPCHLSLLHCIAASVADGDVP